MNAIDQMAQITESEGWERWWKVEKEVQRLQTKGSTMTLLPQSAAKFLL